jgi:hypothetical protein
VASLELHNQTYRVVFMYGGRKFGYSLDTADRQTAEALKGGVEKTLMLIGQGALDVPDGGDVVAFVRSGGKTAEPPTAAPPTAVTFADFKQRDLDTHRDGAMEANSFKTAAMHLAHFERTLGERFALQQLALADLQRHVNERRKKLYRGKPLSPNTLKKETATFRAAWNWASCFVGHTGARRSETTRVLVSDVDFEGKTVLVREKKRSRRQRTTRRVPLTPFLAGVLNGCGPATPCRRCHPTATTPHAGT